jgi:hypothetical protein
MPIRAFDMRPLVGACLVCLVALFPACGDDDSSTPATTGGKSGTGGANTGGSTNTGGANTGGSGGDASAGAAGEGEPGIGGSGGEGTVPLEPCLDRPNVLPRPPVSQLPCDLLPPGFGQ